MEKNKNPLRRIYDWTLSLAERRLSGLWLGLLSFAEASFFPIPPDVLLLPLCLGNLKKAFYFALICSVASVLGGLSRLCNRGVCLGYNGSLVFPVCARIHRGEICTPEGMVCPMGLATCISCWVFPIPYKIFTIASGVLGMALAPFILASAVSRSARFFLVAALVAKFGEPMKQKIDRHFNLLALVFGGLLVGGFLALKFLR